MRNTDGHLIHISGDGTDWNSPKIDMGLISSAPALASWSVKHLVVFATNATDHLIARQSHDSSKWTDGTTVPGLQGFKGGPAAVGSGPNRSEVVVRDGNGQVSHGFMLAGDENPWHGWEAIGDSISSAPALATSAPDRLDIFAAGPEGNLIYTGRNIGDPDVREWLGASSTTTPPPSPGDRTGWTSSSGGWTTNSATSPDDSGPGELTRHRRVRPDIVLDDWFSTAAAAIGRLVPGN